MTWWTSGFTAAVRETRGPVGLRMWHTAGRFGLGALWTLGLALGLASLPSPVSAHPHVFIDSDVKVLFAGDRIDGIRLTWTFDDLFSGLLLQEFDRDRNGALSPSEVHQIEEKHLADLRRVRYFTVVSLNGKDVAPGSARDFSATVAKGLVTYQFTLPLTAPLASTTAIEVVVDDPSYYIAYIVTMANPASQAVGAFLVECRLEHDKMGVNADAIRCGVRRR